MNDFNDKVGAALKEARENAGITRREVAAALGLTENSIFKLEIGETNINANRIAELLGLYKVNIGDFFNGL
jgi:transcriptional regulator with XRE-family HTH domain